MVEDLTESSNGYVGNFLGTPRTTWSKEGGRLVDGRAVVGILSQPNWGM